MLIQLQHRGGSKTFRPATNLFLGINGQLKIMKLSIHGLKKIVIINMIITTLTGTAS